MCQWLRLSSMNVQNVLMFEDVALLSSSSFDQSNPTRFLTGWKMNIHQTNLDRLSIQHSTSLCHTEKKNLFWSASSIVGCQLKLVAASWNTSPLITRTFCTIRSPTPRPVLPRIACTTRPVLVSWWDHDRVVFLLIFLGYIYMWKGGGSSRPGPSLPKDYHIFYWLFGLGGTGYGGSAYSSSSDGTWLVWGIVSIYAVDSFSTKSSIEY